MKIKFYPINIKTNLETGTPLFGYFKFEPCDCGCTDYYGWGFNLIFFGFNVKTKDK